MRVETHLSNGLPSFTIVGLPEAAVRESRERVRCALVNSGFEFPMRRVTVNLAPADLPKEGGRFDLAIAIGVLVASGQLSPDSVSDCEFLSELALGGACCPVKGVLPSLAVAEATALRVYVAKGDARYRQLLSSEKIVGVNDLLELVQHLREPNAYPLQASPVVDKRTDDASFASIANLSEVVGQYSAKHALEVAAAGGHNLLTLYINKPQAIIL